MKTIKETVGDLYGVNHPSPLPCVKVKQNEVTYDDGLVQRFDRSKRCDHNVIGKRTKSKK